MSLAAMRPKRADAIRNRDLVLAAAASVFEEKGTDGSVAEIARRAGVGIGTVYRNFCSRRELITATYAAEIDEVRQLADQLTEGEPFEGLAAWTDALMTLLVTKRNLLTMTDHDDIAPSLVPTLCAAGRPLLVRAQDTGAVRADLSIVDLTMLITAIAKSCTCLDAQCERLTRIVVAGLCVGGAPVVPVGQHGC